MGRSKILRIVMTLIVLLVFIVYFVLNTEKFKPLLHANPFLLILIAIGNILSIAISGIFTKVILQPFNKHISIAESFYVSFISSVGNFFAPAGTGFGFRAIYLRKKFNLAYSDFISTLSGNYIILFLVNSGLALLALLYLRGESSPQYGVLVATFSAMFLTAVSLSFFRFPIAIKVSVKNKYLAHFFKNLQRIMDGWNYVSSNKRLMSRLIWLMLLSFVFNMGMIWAIIHSINLQIGLAALILFSSISSLGLFINITPANLGIKEAIYLFSSGVLGFSTTQILSIALIDRGVMFLVLAGLWVASHRLKASFSETLAK